ncbi:PAS domain S-box protein, partial [Metapseudomonas otitidis]|uniref:PAS domain S-box protein n=1 Tax=Metapseudomonas otitidis TaxID=319939 RepID=UPI001F0D0342
MAAFSDDQHEPLTASRTLSLGPSDLTSSSFSRRALRQGDDSMWLNRKKESAPQQTIDALELASIRRSMATIEFTPDGIILDASPAFLNVVGYRLEEVVGQHHRLFCPRQLAESAAYQQFWQRLRQGERFS